MSTSPIVTADRLTKEFYAGFWRPRPHRALDALSFEVPEGGVFGLLGPNGAGKSTTLKLLMDLLKPTSGRAALLGRPAGDVRARQRVGFLPENPTFYDQLSAEELLVYFAGLFGYSGHDRVRRASVVLDRVGLGADRRRPLRQYSKGMIQRVGLAQALVNDPALVILDEPMSGLDPVGRREVRDIIIGLRDEGRTVLFSSHILSDAELLCSRVGILARGRLVASGPTAELTASGTPGWEVVLTSVPPDLADQLRVVAARVTQIDTTRYSVELADDMKPETLVANAAAAGASLVSVTPLRTTLEDVFLRAVGLDTPDARVAGQTARAAGPVENDR
ncbi:MAG: ABC transporter ATP-binding protein [Vicinamibacterales bacterium]